MGKIGKEGKLDRMLKNILPVQLGRTAPAGLTDRFSRIPAGSGDGPNMKVAWNFV
jgi:hypothetical protein